jgi:SecD/SecF fusion protein
LQESLSIKNIVKKADFNFVTNFSKNFFTNPFFDLKKWTYLFSAIVVVVSVSIIGNK